MPRLKLGLGLTRSAGVSFAANNPLSLNFENNIYGLDGARKSFGDIFDFSRSGTATYVDASGIIQDAATNEPRFDYTAGRRGLLVEDSSTNLVDESENLTTSGGWNVGANITQNGATTLAGLTAYSFTSQSDGNSFIRKFPSTTSGQTYTYSFITNLSAMPSGGVSFDDDIVDSAKYSSAGSVEITEIASGVFRWSQTFVSSDTTMTVFAGPVDRDNGTTFIVTACQLEQKNGATSYIPTSGSAVTRARDVAKIDGVEFASFYNESEGTVYIDFLQSVENSGGFPRIFEFNSGSEPNRISVFQNTSSNKLGVDIKTSGLTVGLGQDVISFGQNRKLAVALKDDDCASFEASGSLETVTSVTLPTADRLDFGTVSYGGVSITSLRIYNFNYYNERLSNAEIESLTS